jgi:membrane protein implicated in regulation of membrane protease activity
MSEANIWWLVTGALVALELTTGTFYLLMLGIGSVAAALTAHAGYGLNAQLAAAAVVGALGAALVGQWRRRRVKANTGLAPSQHLDIGATVQVSDWDAQGTARVQHRGATWTAVLAEGQQPSPGAYHVKDVQGNRLVLEKR